MSAFMIDNENLTRIAKYTTAILNDQRGLRLCEGIGCYEFGKEDIARFKTLEGACDEDGWFNERVIHKEVYELNKAALVGRYGECNDEYEPIDETIKIDTTEEGRKEWQCRLYNILRGYLYQCAEEGARDHWLFAALTGLKNDLANIIAQTTAYDNWGCSWCKWDGKKGK